MIYHSMNISLLLLLLLLLLITMDQVTIRWLNAKWRGVEETVVRSRVRKTGVLQEGMVVNVTYKRCQYKAEIVSHGMPIRRRISNYRRSAAQIRHLPANNLPADDPPANDLPADDADDQPANDLPADDPPANDPPADDLPANDPPANDLADGDHLVQAILDDMSELSSDPATSENASDLTTSASSTPDSELVCTLLRQNAELRKENKELQAELAATRAVPRKNLTPTTVAGDSGTVVIGSNEASYTMGAADYYGIFSRATSPKDFVLRLVGSVFPENFLASCNFYGGTVFNGKARSHKQGLFDTTAFRAILAQTEIEFPG